MRKQSSTTIFHHRTEHETTSIHIFFSPPSTKYQIYIFVSWEGTCFKYLKSKVISLFKQRKNISATGIHFFFFFMSAKHLFFFFFWNTKVQCQRSDDTICWTNKITIKTMLITSCTTNVLLINLHTQKKEKNI